MRTAWALAILAPLTFTACASTLPRKTSEDLRLCQSKSEDPKTGCPDGTLYVSDTNDQADFSSVQDAILSLPQDASPRIILIGSGTYEEQLNVTRPGPLTLLGELEEEPEQPYADVEDEPTARPNEVTILWKAANSGGSYPDNVYTSCLVVAPTLNASFTGSGPTGWPVPEGTPFGCSDFRAYNIDFRNQYSKQADGPSHAFTVAYANAGFYSCGFYSYQDTVRISKPSLVRTQLTMWNRYLLASWETSFFTIVSSRVRQTSSTASALTSLPNLRCSSGVVVVVLQQ